MLGYDVSWAAFNVIEVMSSSKFTHKVWSGLAQLAYLLSLQYHPESERSVFSGVDSL